MGIKVVALDFSDCRTLGEAMGMLEERFAELTRASDEQVRDMLMDGGYPTDEEIASAQLMFRGWLADEREAVARAVAARFLDPQADLPAKTLQ